MNGDSALIYIESIKQLKARYCRYLRAVALVALTRPGHEHHPVQAVEIGVVEVSLLDVPAHQRLAAPIGWFRTELARTAPSRSSSMNGRIRLSEKHCARSFMASRLPPERHISSCTTA